MEQETKNPAVMLGYDVEAPGIENWSKRPFAAFLALGNQPETNAILIGPVEAGPTGRLGGDDAAFITAALGTIARARGMSNLARETGLTREGLYKACRRTGTPSSARS